MSGALNVRVHYFPNVGNDNSKACSEKMWKSQRRYKSIVLAGATQRELDKKQRKGNRMQGENTFVQRGLFCWGEYQRKGHSIHPLSCDCNQQEDDVHGRISVYEEDE